MVGILHGHRAVLLDITRVYRPGAFAADMEHRLVDILGEHQRQGLEPLNDLVHVLQHALDGLVLVHHAIQSEAPHGAPAKAGEQEPAQ